MAIITKENARSRMKAKKIPVDIRVAFLSGALGNCCSRRNDKCDDKCIENFMTKYLNDEAYKKSVDVLIKEPKNEEERRQRQRQSKIMWHGPMKSCR
jgi:hypothetical protein